MFHRRRNTTSARSRHPDVLLIIVDDLRPDLGAFGNKNAQTPHIDALAASAVTFTAAFAPVASGRNPVRNDARDGAQLATAANAAVKVTAEAASASM